MSRRAYGTYRLICHEAAAENQRSDYRFGGGRAEVGLSYGSASKTHRERTVAATRWKQPLRPSAFDTRVIIIRFSIKFGFKKVGESKLAFESSIREKSCWHVGRVVECSIVLCE